MVKQAVSGAGEEARNAGRKQTRPVISRVLDDGTIVELVYDNTSKRTRLLVGTDGAWKLSDFYAASPTERLVPYSSNNNLIQHGVVLFPSEPENYGTEETLVENIRAYIHRYVDLTPTFLDVAAHYVMFSWLYDAFNELPYLRAQGDFGSGKTRFLLIIGAICYHPIFASGASTVSPIFHILDSFGGTLIVDEADFRFSDEKADVVKILNNGNVRGFPILRSEQSPKGEFNPRAFSVYGPKLVATRGTYDDPALESRFITELMGTRALRPDVPINLPASYQEEALSLRNQLLSFRLSNLGAARTIEIAADRFLEPRLAQIFSPLLATIRDVTVRERIRKLARDYDADLRTSRTPPVERRVLEIIVELQSGPSAYPLSMKAIAEAFQHRFAGVYGATVTPKWIGAIVRRKLGLQTEKRHGTFVIAPAESERLANLAARYGAAGDIGDVGDVA